MDNTEVINLLKEIRNYLAVLPCAAPPISVCRAAYKGSPVGELANCRY